MPVSGHALTQLIAGRPAFAPGSVWLVGAGPGDPGHLTVDAVAALGQADVVLHDALVNEQVLALACPGARLVFAGKRAGRHSVDQDSIIEQLIAFARADNRVLRLKGGDPLIFGRGGEEMLALAAAGVPFRIVPGITAGLAGLAAASIPATLRDINQTVVFATGHSADGTEAPDWAAIARLDQPIVLYMAMRRLGSIAGALIDGGLSASTPVAVIASATVPAQQVLISTLGAVARDLDTSGIEPPAVIAIGEIVAVRERLASLAPALAESLA
jgi:uroporphyrin-III C-methyltransferase